MSAGSLNVSASNAGLSDRSRQPGVQPMALQRSPAYFRRSFLFFWEGNRFRGK